jgi:general secretion pathway protein G
MRRNGFSLIELLVAITIMVILAGVVGLNLMREPGRARMARARAEIGLLKTALQMYLNDNRSLPTPRQGLQALVRKPDVEPIPVAYPAGGYLDRPALPRDPWDNDYLYFVPGRHGERFEVVSYGGDGQAGGNGEDADLSSSDP